MNSFFFLKATSCISVPHYLVPESTLTMDAQANTARSYTMCHI